MPWWTRPGPDALVVHGTPGPVLDADGEPVLGPDGEPLEKVLVPLRSDHHGEPEEEAWVDPRVAWQWDESTWLSPRVGDSC